VKPEAAEAVKPRPVPNPEPEPADEGPVVLVAIPDAELAKQTAAVLQQRGLRTSMVHDGVEAMLELQRQLPKAVLLSASLPKMYGFQVCEVVKRNESLRSIVVVLAGSIHHTDRYRREPNELYGADAYIEDPDLPEGLIPVLERMGISMTEVAAPTPEVASPPEPAAPEPLQSAPSQPLAPEPAPPDPPALVAAPQAPAAEEDDGLAEERAKAERLARIIVSDIVLYNEEKFADAVARNSVAEVMSPDLEEGRELFRSRIDERVREEQDYLVAELLRVARLRGMP
jgi:CheY-like chemotaxis protein